MLILTLLSVLLLALYCVASTSTVVTMGDADGYQEAQQWAADLDASLCPMQRAVSMGLVADPWTMPAKLAALLAPVVPMAPKPRTTRTKRINAPRGYYANTGCVYSRPMRSGVAWGAAPRGSSSQGVMCA